MLTTKHPWQKKIWYLQKKTPRKNKIHHQAQQIPPLKSTQIRPPELASSKSCSDFSRRPSLAALNKEAANFFRVACGINRFGLHEKNRIFKKWTSKNKSFEKISTRNFWMKLLVVFLNRRSKTRNFLVVNRRSEKKKKSLALALAAWDSAWPKAIFAIRRCLGLNHGQGGKSISNLEVGMIFSCIPEWYMFQKNACFFQSWTTVENVFCGVFRPLKHNPTKKK